MNSYKLEAVLSIDIRYNRVFFSVWYLLWGSDKKHSHRNKVSDQNGMVNPLTAGSD